jgi:Domain of unknown function (DUF1772)
MFLVLQIVSVFMAAITMSLALAHALEFPGKLRLSREFYVVTQSIYYPGFTIAGTAEFAALLATLALLLLTPANSPAFPWTLSGLVGLIAVHTIYWLYTHPVNKFWVKDLELQGAGAAFFSLTAERHRLDMNLESTEDWKKLRNRWEYSHLARAILAMISLIALIVAVAVR